MPEEIEGRITEPTPQQDGYEPVEGSTLYDALERLGILEDMIESGELMTPEAKPGDTVYFIYKDAVVLEGTLLVVFTEYDEEEEAYFFHVRIANDFYDVIAQRPASEYNQTWFKTQAAAEAALLAIQQAQQAQQNEQAEP